MTTSRKLLLSHYAGFSQVVHIDSERPEDLILESVQELEPIIEAAKALSELEPGKDFRHAAIIPQIVLEQSFREGWFNDKSRWKKWANDPANKPFRTWPGNL